jgi:putative DNA primase/helicase
MQLSKHSQLRWFADWFAGRPVARYTADKFFSGAYRYVWSELTARKQLKPTAKPAALWKLFSVLSTDLLVYHGADGQDLSDRLRSVIDPERRWPNLLELAATLQPLTWLWENWLPIGMLSLLAARPGTGKSLVALDLCRRIIAGEAWPDGSAQPAPGSPCIYVDAENVPAILNRRAEEWESWGMDRRLLYPVIPAEEDGIVNLGDDRYRDLLMNMAFRLQPRLIIVDSLRDILPAGESNVEDVRGTLAFLSNLASANDCAVLLVHHLRKSSNGGQLALLDSIDLDQVSGSGYIGGRARVVLGLTKVQTGAEPDKNGPRKIEIIKTNLGEYPPDMGILFEKMPPDGLRLTWTANAPQRYSEEDAPIAPTLRGNAKDWLLAYLAEVGEPVAPKQAVIDAQEVGISQATLYRARAELEGQVVNSLGRRAPGNCWQLAEDSTEG